MAGQYLIWTQTAQNVRYHCVAALVLLTWDICVTMKDEVECIWSKPRNCYIKWLFLSLRYVGIVVQIINVAIVIAIESFKPVHSVLCETLYIYQTVAFQILMAIVYIILVIRVYAFYNRNFYVALSLIVIFCIQIAIAFFCIKSTIPLFRYTPSCLLQVAPHELIYYTIGPLTCHSIIMILTIIRHIQAWKAGQGRVPIVSLMVRDGIGSYGVFIFLLGSTAYLITGDASFGGSAYYWVTAVIVLVGCRTIINMQLLNAPVDESNIKLSTVFVDTEDISPGMIMALSEANG